MNVSRQFMNRALIVLAILAPVDFRVRGVDSRPNPVSIGIIVQKALHRLSDQRVRAAVLAAFDLSCTSFSSSGVSVMVMSRLLLFPS